MEWNKWNQERREFEKRNSRQWVKGTRLGETVLCNMDGILTWAAVRTISPCISDPPQWPLWTEEFQNELKIKECNVRNSLGLTQSSAFIQSRTIKWKFPLVSLCSPYDSWLLSIDTLTNYRWYQDPQIHGLHCQKAMREATGNHHGGLPFVCVVVSCCESSLPLGPANRSMATLD